MASQYKRLQETRHEEQVSSSIQEDTFGDSPTRETISASSDDIEKHQKLVISLWWSLLPTVIIFILLWILHSLIFHTWLSMTKIVIITLIFLLGWTSHLIMDAQVGPSVTPQPSLIKRLTIIPLVRLIPRRVLSRVWGSVAERHIKTQFMRRAVYSLWTVLFDCKVEEMVAPMTTYESLAAFFDRPIRLADGLRPIQSQFVSPCDCRFSSGGPLDGAIPAVKGLDYTPQRLLGLPAGAPITAGDQASNLWYCVLYLAPGDYHSFHAPCAASFGQRKHVPGDLWPVNSTFMPLVPGLLAENERVNLIGHWEHGFFGFSAVGAYNVGSIYLSHEEDLVTNRKVSRDQWHHPLSLDYSPGLDVDVGDKLGGFRLGSTVVLVFTPPPGFQFGVHPGQKLKMGQSLGHWDE